MTRTILVCVALCGCDLFPAELLDASVDAPETLALGEDCTGDVPLLSGFDDAIIDLTLFADDVDSVATCTGRTTPGADGFFALNMQAGEKWHFHVRNMSGSGLDPAIYVLDSVCDARRCGPNDGVDRCGDDRDEHLTFVAPGTGIFFVGIDSHVEGGGVYQMLAVRPECGDGEIEHSETCDDGNTDLGDGCDALCRVELTTGSSAEEEPNDDYTGANLVMLAGAAVDVTAQLASDCDVDLYAVESVAGALEVEMLAPGGVGCADGTALFDLRILDAEASVVLATGAVEAGNACPVLRATGLPAGEVIIAVSTSEEPRVFNYVLRIQTP